jgi:hypothetical protein
MIYDKVESSQIDFVPELGGHSAMWAIRSQMESCKTFIAPSASEFTLQNLKYKNEHHELLKTPLNQNDLESDATKLDIHLVLEYNEGD